VSPKAGLIWTPTKDTTMRFGYSQSLGGATLDQSYQLEPSQVAGFVQSFRSVIPESVAGGNAGAKFEMYGLSLEQKFKTGTYLAVSGEILNSDVDRKLGSFDFLVDQQEFPIPSVIRNKLDYNEKSATISAHQLLGQRWAVGARYRVSKATLDNSYPDIPSGIFGDLVAKQHQEGLLHEVDLSALYNHPCGFFSAGEAVWYSQDNSGYSPSLPGDEFWQLNAFFGYRFFRRRAEVRLGVLNITDEDYRLNPLNIYSELPRERTLSVRLQLNF
jgi:outer membrane receptor protein involved in Fe transport